MASFQSEDVSVVVVIVVVVVVVVEVVVEIAAISITRCSRATVAPFLVRCCLPSFMISAVPRCCALLAPTRQLLASKIPAKRRKVLFALVDPFMEPDIREGATKEALKMAG